MFSAIYIENLGCAKNQVDAEVMGAQLESEGRSWVADPADADLILVNTCGFIEPAQQQSIDTTLSLLATHPDTAVALAGCMAQRFADELAEGMPELVGIFGNREPHLIGEFLRRIEGDSQLPTPLVWIPPGGDTLTDASRTRFLSHPGSGYIKIAEGCDHACSFCAIPAIRGRLRRRPATDIIEEFRRMRHQGVVEFNLVAQDLAAWRDPSAERRAAFPELIELLLAEEGAFWLRSLYLYPDTFPQELVDIAAADHRFLPYFDLSFQHASSQILRRMGRPGTSEEYLELIDSIRVALPDSALRSSFIVGFPGETESDIEELAQFLERATLEWVGVFEYSPQTGTPAASMGGDLPPEEIRRRREYIESVQQPIVTARLKRFVRRRLSVLVEERIEGTEICIGRSLLQAPEVDGVIVVHNTPPMIVPGAVISVDVDDVTEVDLQATYHR